VSNYKTIISFSLTNSGWKNIRERKTRREEMVKQIGEMGGIVCSPSWVTAADQYQSSTGHIPASYM